MAEKKEDRNREQYGREKVQFIVTREFSGSQTMREAFEQLIERLACERLEEKLGRRAG